MIVLVVIASAAAANSKLDEGLDRNVLAARRDDGDDPVLVDGGNGYTDDLFGYDFGADSWYSLGDGPLMTHGSLPEFSSRGSCFWDRVRFYGDYPKPKPLDKPDVSGCFGGYPVWGRLAMVRRAGWKLVSDEGNGFGLVTGPRAMPYPVRTRRGWQR